MHVDYVIELYFQADEEPHVYIGIVPRGSARYSVAGKGLTDSTHLAGRTLKLAMVSQSDHVLDFNIVNETSGVAMPYHLPFEVIPCSCRRYDGP